MQTNVEVMGWYTLLIRHFARPFLPFVFPGRRVQGFDYEGQPSRFATEEARFFNPSGALYAAELGKLANLLVEQSQGTLLYRLESLYDEILVDEVCSGQLIPDTMLSFSSARAGANPSLNW